MTLCQCGCGRPAPIAQRTFTRYGHVKGQPLRFIRGHGGDRQARLEHGNNRGGQRSPAYRSWCSMKQRCSNPNSNRWLYYGGRGITVCSAWADFTTFLADMGVRPDGTSLDRIDPDGDYEPGNCRWATPKVQRQNRS